MIMWENVLLVLLKRWVKDVPFSQLLHVIFNSEILLENTERNLQKKFKSLSQHLVSLQTVSSHEADKALIQHGNVKTDHWKAGVDLSKISHLNDLFQRIESCEVSQILPSHQNRSDTKPWRSRCWMGLFP